MSDSFADLWNTTAPAKPEQTARKLGSSHSQSPPLRRPQYDAFALLANAQSTTSASSSRPITPSSLQAAQKTATKPTQVNGDAFSGLLPGSIASSSNETINMSLKERLAAADRQRQGLVDATVTNRSTPASPWDQLDSIARSSSAASKPSPVSQDDDWAFSSLAPAAAPASTLISRSSSGKSSLLEDDDWNLGTFSSPTTASRANAADTSSSNSLLDFDEFTSAPQTTSVQPSRSGTPGEFDFGDREDRLLDDDSNGEDEDDILGILSKPVDAIPKYTATVTGRSPSSGSPQPLSTSTSRSRASSPPPHIIGQIVEMGFSPQQARVALAATDSGVDVQAALEMLLSNGAGDVDMSASQQTLPSRQERSTPTSRTRAQIFAGGEDSGAYSPPRRRRPPARPVRSGQSPPPSGDGVSANINLQEQADKIISQANDFGLSVFNRANALWKEGREKVQKAYEERAAVAAATSGQGKARASPSGRPKWMQDAAGAGDADDEWGGSVKTGGGSGYRDDHDGENEVLPPEPKLRSQPTSNGQENAFPDSSQRRSTLSSLLSDEPAAYVSPKRRRPAARASSSGLNPAASPPPAPSVPGRALSPVQLRQRQAIPASSSALATAAKHKAAGTEMFKLGRYAEAENAYSSAIAALPAAHLVLVPLYNNRALTRLKTGDSAGAVADCSAVVEIIGPGYHPAREAKVSGEELGGSVDLGDGLMKALKRRAEAHEGREKWDDARRDWEAIIAAEWAGKFRGDAIKGAGRCRRMTAIDIDSGETATVAVRPSKAPAPKPPRPVPSARKGPAPPSEALTRLREAANAQDAEEQERYALKDTVDARLVGWRGGKETNLRALLASLDTVLWPALGWQKIGMAELVAPAQVKVRYTKAIAKLHPDKLNSTNTTLEQRMIANGVFGTLNEAWNSFKP